MSNQHPGVTDGDWRLVRAFIAVMQEGNLTAAARRLGATQPTVGRQIRDLERRSGNLLFLRRGTTFEPTEYAHSLFPGAIDVERALHGLLRGFAPRQHDGPSILRLTLPTLLADEMLPGLLPALAMAMPSVAFEILPSDSVQDLLRRDADLAIRLTEPRQPDLITRRLGTIRIGLYATRAYIDVHTAPKDPADLAGHMIIGPVDARGIPSSAASLGFPMHDAARRLRTDDLRHRLALVRAGLGIGPCHDWIAASDPHLLAVLPGIEITRLGVWIVANDDLNRSRAVRTAFDHLSLTVSDRLCRG